ncbi:zinc-binding metallopeptidase family protein [Variovorax paradoxus]|uniref:zinc-binding metallopeptidase family protein n=1 Tax=Variovorax paradoxus TaxID=34073 RepID=UPI0024809137|nr:putative zinc-binding metallopeptidase [Variovorax paradoxus]WGT61443.1 putative zinc-binding metallopeptidase [Variovorax paradoxus]
MAPQSDQPGAQTGNQAGAADQNTAQAAPNLAAELAAPTVSRAYRCQCGRPVFLRNSQCLACHTPLGYVIERLGVVPLAPVEEAGDNQAQAEGEQPLPGTFTVFGNPDGKRYRRCANLMTAASCNWMVPAPREGDDPAFNTDGLAPGYCLACSVNRTIPDLSVESNGELWRKLEHAKRRLISQLLALGLPVVSRHADPAHGLAFDFLSNMPGSPHVMTGHEHGVITLNAEEAEDAVRERIRAEMREPYRTLLGHFRHEIGHYYWDLLVQPTAWLDEFRVLFGDERADYTAALQRHYEQGPPPDWSIHFVSSYASMHPWEDWAETWAHYLHMADTTDTAMSFGVDATNVELASDLFTLEDLWRPEHPGAAKFLDFLNGWVLLTNVLNELSRSMGQPDYYPFVLPRAAVGKLQFIHCVVTEQRDRPSSTAAAPTVPLPEGSQPPVPANEPADEPPNEPVNEPANGPANGPEPDQSQSQTQMQSQQQNAAQF